MVYIGHMPSRRLFYNDRFINTQMLSTITFPQIRSLQTLHETPCCAQNSHGDRYNKEYDIQRHFPFGHCVMEKLHVT